MITLEQHELVFRFPEVHEHAVLRIDFQRTLRIPDDNRTYPLPAGLGSFPLAHVDDYKERVPKQWYEHGGVFLPMYQAEALWIHFNTLHLYPFAVKVAAGKIDAVTGKEWNRELHRKPQDYMGIPAQPWLDGFSVSKNTIRQFVAMPLGDGYTAEEQLTGKAEHGGLQIIVYPMKRERYLKLLDERIIRMPEASYYSQKMFNLGASLKRMDMGLAPGGLMKQEIYKDKYGLEAWDTSVSSRSFVHIVNSLQYRKITGVNPPTEPPTAYQYSVADIPWFDYYDAEATALKGSKKLAGMDSVAAKGIKKGEDPLPENEPIVPTKVNVITKIKNLVREGKF